MEKVTSGASTVRFAKQAKPAVRDVKKFTGREEELEGFIYDITSAKNTDTYSKTTKEIARYVGTLYKHGGDVKRSVEDKTMFPIPPPTKPTAPGLGAAVEGQEAYDFKKKVYQEEIKEFVKRKAILRDNLRKL